jgi:fructose-1,6-bisphosphatase/inositol monophosphatase family enzyme
VAERAARRAAAAILAERGRATVSIKPDGSPVTSADLAADRAIRATVGEACPRDGILTEEGTDDGRRLSCRRCWIADPLDGTRYFVDGSDDFDTFVALAVDGTPAVAVALQPVTGLLLAAARGRGAWVEAGDGARRRLALAPEGRPRLATKGWLGAPGNEPALARVARLVGGRLLQPAFSLGPRCFLPPGAPIDAMIGLPVTAPLDAWEWDLAAVDLIVREAGGATSDLAGGGLRYNRADPRFREGLVIAAAPDLHQRLLEALRVAGAAGPGGPA